ncbi:serine/threonine-protein kinase D6PKL2 [Tanacetum coccineum]
MLTDFDLSLKCDVTASTPAQVFSGPNNPTSTDHYTFDPPKVTSSLCIIPNCIVPSVSCFNLRRRRKKKPENQTGPQFVAEPVNVRSMSFVGTHEYLAPEIVSGEGHGSAVDWWTLGIFMFELFYGVTPFRGMDNELTLANIVARALEFPKEPAIPPMAKDLISQLLAKDPARRQKTPLGIDVGNPRVHVTPVFMNGVSEFCGRVPDGFWSSFMSPYERKYVDVKFGDKVTGSVTVGVDEG